MLVVKTLMILIMISGEFVWARDRDLYMGLFQQTQRCQNSDFFAVIIFSLTFICGRERWGRGWAQNPEKGRLVSGFAGLQRSVGQAPKCGLGHGCALLGPSHLPTCALQSPVLVPWPSAVVVAGALLGNHAGALSYVTEIQSHVLEDDAWVQAVCVVMCFFICCHMLVYNCRVKVA